MMAYPEKSAGYEHKPKWLDRMREDEKPHQHGAGQREDLREQMGRSLDRESGLPEDPTWPARYEGEPKPPVTDDTNAEEE